MRQDLGSPERDTYALFEVRYPSRWGPLRKPFVVGGQQEARHSKVSILRRPRNGINRRDVIFERFILVVPDRSDPLQRFPKTLSCAIFFKKKSPVNNFFPGKLCALLLCAVKAPYGCQVLVLLTAWFQFQSSPEVTTVTGCPM